MKTALNSGQALLRLGYSPTDCRRREPDIPLGVGCVRMLADLPEQAGYDCLPHP